jgi:hypothetical protein
MTKPTSGQVEVSWLCPDAWQPPAVTEGQLAELRANDIDWFFYCLWRQTLDHDGVVMLFSNTGDSPPVSRSE